MTDPSQSSSASEDSGWLTERRVAYLFGTTFVVVMLTLDSREIAERAFALAKDHSQLCSMPTFEKTSTAEN